MSLLPHWIICRASLKESMTSMVNQDIGKALSQLRWFNMILGLATLGLNIFGIIGNIISPGKMLMNGFSILFAGILCLYELQIKKLGNKLRKLYGFLYTYIGRACYLFL